MKVIHTDEINPEQLSPSEREAVYNGLDCCVTREVLDVLLPQLDQYSSKTYNFSRALQGPVLEMRLRGLRVDQRRKQEVIEEYFDKIDRLERQLETIVFNGVGMPSFNWRSNADLHQLFYNRLGLPPIIRSGRPTVNRDALERLTEYMSAKQIVNHIIKMRDLAKKIAVLRTEIDDDGRIRTSYNIAGTSTGRFSSSFTEFGSGGNLQNIEESLRSIFISDPGYKFAKFDGQQIQSRIVGAIVWHLFKDGRYLDACESGDLHTAVAKMCWPALPWTGDPKKDKDLAETPFYRHYSYRFMCKKIGHGSNFMGKPPTIATQTKLPISVIAQFQPRYFSAFPGILSWHEWIANQIQRHGYIVTITGARRFFWGRRTDDKTWRDAAAYDPQNTEAFIINSALLNIWRSDLPVQVLLQDHDALVVQYPEEQEDELIPKIQKLLEVPIKLNHGRELLIPFDAKVGWNRGDWNEQNPDGLKDYKPGDKRKRSPEVGILDRPLRSFNRKSRSARTFS
jgi:DNA polymerase-1